MKFLFVDTNLYKTIYSSSSDLSSEVFDLLVKLIDKKQLLLLLPVQTKEELERNCARRWPEEERGFFETKIKKLEDEKVDGGKKFGKYKQWEEMERALEKELTELKRLKEQAQEKYLVKTSPQNLKIQALFNKAVLIEETPEIVSAADLRMRKGNPPYNKDKIGDHLIWESLLHYLQMTDSGDEKKTLIFLSNDKAGFGDDGFFDPWLLDELESKTGASLSYIRQYSDIPELTKAEQGKIKNEEEIEKKKSIISAFIGSDSWSEAGSNAARLLWIKDLLETEDYEQILSAATTNSQIRGSFFTAEPLTSLVSGEEGYVDRRLESIDVELWNKFQQRYGIQLKRQSDSIESVNMDNGQAWDK